MIAGVVISIGVTNIRLVARRMVYFEGILARMT